ncbi:hypothetical protein BDP27DRAFT_1435555 [Rhodocollybia butyracea]|uniref:Uncharacterized protein n=1 Tax=Rhodocollybia butyracea TaxID=206335 RepID=A0A9P5P779_9AGAR|nr:hypothetical protein BDP27DRAFT_1435555 [Rhodocollybia butyracea]
MFPESLHKLRCRIAAFISPDTPINPELGHPKQGQSGQGSTHPAHAPPSIPELHSVSSSRLPAQFLPEGPSPYFQPNHFPSFQNMPTNGYAGPLNMFAAPFHFSAGLGGTPLSSPSYSPFSKIPPPTHQGSHHATQNDAHSSQRETAKDVSPPANSPNPTTPPELPQPNRIPYQTLGPGGIPSPATCECGYR